MNQRKHIRIPILLCAIAALTALPAEVVGQPKEKKLFFLSQHIHEMEVERGELIKKLEDFPPLIPHVMNGVFGFHSTFFPLTETNEPLNSSIDFYLQYGIKKTISSIVLVPAFNPRFGAKQSYGFPRRFRIELRETRGGEPIKIFDFTKEDFPNPGLAPIVLSDVNVNAVSIRVVVERGVVHDGSEFYALGEVYIFAQKKNKEVSNVAPFTTIQAPDTFHSPPAWNTEYLTDRISVLGTPLGATQKENTDFVVSMPITEYPETHSIQIIIDLKETTPIGRLALFPALPPKGISLPRFGYPHNIQVEGFATRNFNAKPAISIEVSQLWGIEQFMLLGDTFFIVPLHDTKMRYIRITLSGFPEHAQRRILALGEVAAFYTDKNLAFKKPVTVWGLGADIAPDSSTLVDNYACNQEIIDPEKWLKGLALRHINQSRLDLVEATMETLRRKNYQLKVNITTTTLLGGMAWLLGLYIRSRVIRARESKTIRRQISRDLHDDVGSSIGALGLGLEHLKGSLRSDEELQLVDDLQLLSREASAALREAITLSQKDSTTLQALLHTIKERSLFILGKNVVRFEIASNLPPMQIDLIHKRNILLIFKEALHNFSQHAHASELRIVADDPDGKTFRLCLIDNGKGFNPEHIRADGWGLATMSERATEAGGSLEIESSPGEGTRLTLTIPFQALNQKGRKS